MIGKATGGDSDYVEIFRSIAFPFLSVNTDLVTTRDNFLRNSQEVSLKASIREVFVNTKCYDQSLLSQSLIPVL